MTDIELRILLWSQAATYGEICSAAKLVDRLGFALLWTWDESTRTSATPASPILEGWSLLKGWPARPSGSSSGSWSAPTRPQPGLVASRRDLDHAGDGRTILGIGGAWIEPEHGPRHRLGSGPASGSTGSTNRSARCGGCSMERGSARRGRATTRSGCPHLPAPVQAHLPIMIGGSGEKKTLRTVARYGDMWNGMARSEG